MDCLTGYCEQNDEPSGSGVTGVNPFVSLLVSYCMNLVHLGIDLDER
jgi:hypothetical protein